MTRSELKAIVVETLDNVVRAVGGDSLPLTDGIIPIGGLPNFDSILAEDTTIELFSQVGLDATLDVNPFIKEGRPACIAEVVESVFALLPAEERK